MMVDAMAHVMVGCTLYHLIQIHANCLFYLYVLTMEQPLRIRHVIDQMTQSTLFCLICSWFCSVHLKYGILPSMQEQNMSGWMFLFLFGWTSMIYLLSSHYHRLWKRVVQENPNLH